MFNRETNPNVRRRPCVTEEELLLSLQQIDIMWHILRRQNPAIRTDRCTPSTLLRDGIVFEL